MSLLHGGILEQGRKAKSLAGDLFYLPVALVAFTRFGYLMRRTFFRLMLGDLNTILDGLTELEEKGVETIDCRRAQFSAQEPIVRLRMICQSWKVMFQAEYSSGPPLAHAGGSAGLGRPRAGPRKSARGEKRPSQSQAAAKPAVAKPCPRQACSQTCGSSEGPGCRWPRSLRQTGRLKPPARTSAIRCARMCRNLWPSPPAPRSRAGREPRRCK